MPFSILGFLILKVAHGFNLAYKKCFSSKKIALSFLLMLQMKMALTLKAIVVDDKDGKTSIENIARTVYSQKKNTRNNH
ncbi:MAG: hypothetical protein JKX67_00730 [Colwellia sp.]|nr:hypothetical protein [Colwellia sp.]